jgi:hypothetical protein
VRHPILGALVEIAPEAEPVARFISRLTELQERVEVRARSNDGRTVSASVPGWAFVGLAPHGAIETREIAPGVFAPILPRNLHGR